jgi:co-chaperonin GroES (HSP10)
MKEFKATPLAKYIVINKLEEEQKTESGLILTNEDTKQLRYRKGEVVKSGTLVDGINAGDLIYYDKSSGHEMIINDVPYTIIREQDVVVVL